MFRMIAIFGAVLLLVNAACAAGCLAGSCFQVPASLPGTDPEGGCHNNETPKDHGVPSCAHHTVLPGKETSALTAMNSIGAAQALTAGAYGPIEGARIQLRETTRDPVPPGVLIKLASVVLKV